MNPGVQEVVRANLEQVQARIDAACTAAGRSADEVRLVGVSKYVDAATTAALVKAGCHTLGEARPQQLWAKAEAAELADLPIEWRLIGHLQRNKAERTVAVASAIDSIDSPRLLAAVNKAAGELGRKLPILLEVNISGDAEKHGFTPEGVEAILGELADYPHVVVQGLMAMAAREGGIDIARQNFADLRKLRERLASNQIPLSELSMGMSGDLEAAIAEGSTLVRVGSALWEGLR